MRHPHMHEGHGYPGSLREGLMRGFGFPPGFPFGQGGPGGFGGGFGPGAERGHRRGGRGSRPNVRPALLALLLERPMHGYEMIQELESRTGGIWRPSPGSVYPTLQLLADEGLVASTEEAGGKKLFTLTETGRDEAAKLDGAPPWQQVNDDLDAHAAKLRTAARHLGAAMQQMAHAGTREQQARAVEVLGEARRKLYAILGELDVEEDDPEE